MKGSSPSLAPDPGATIGDALRQANVGTEGFTLSLSAERLFT